MGHGGSVVKISDSQSREPSLDFSCCHFEAWTISLTPRCHSSLSCINEFMATDSGGYVNE